MGSSSKKGQVRFFIKFIIGEQKAERGIVGGKSGSGSCSTVGA